ncbi:MAG: substrate-binding domain-containing protein [Bilifractor sp.]|jgi:ribose transport system substrate-binding protein
MKLRKKLLVITAVSLSAALCACGESGSLDDSSSSRLEEQSFAGGSDETIGEGESSGAASEGVSGVSSVSSSSLSSDEKDGWDIVLSEENTLEKSYTSVDDLNVEPGSSVAIVAKEIDLAYWKAVREGAEQAIDEINEKYGYEKDEKVTLIFDGTKNSTDVDGQINAIDSVLSENPTALCIAAIDMDSCQSQLETASENGIPVITLDSGIESTLVKANCTTDNVSAGKLAMRKMCESISEVGKIAIVTHSQSQKSAVERNEGFAEEIANHSKVEVKARLEENDEESIESMIQATLEVTPELDGIICTNESTTEQVLDALTDLERSDIRVVGFDMGKKQQAAIRDGSEYGTVSENPRGMGYAAVVAALRAASGETVDANIETGYCWIDGENIDQEANRLYIY